MTVNLGQRALLTEPVSSWVHLANRLAKRVCMFRSEVYLCTSMHVRVPGQTGMKGQHPTSRRLPTLSPGQPQEVAHAAVVFGCLKVPAPRAESLLAWNFLLRCRKVFIWSYQCLELTHCICTDSGIMYFCKEKQTYHFQKKRELDWVLFRCPVSVAGFAYSWCDWLRWSERNNIFNMEKRSLALISWAEPLRGFGVFTCWRSYFLIIPDLHPGISPVLLERFGSVRQLGFQDVRRTQMLITLKF